MGRFPNEHAEAFVWTQTLLAQLHFFMPEEEDDGRFHIRYNILGPHNVMIKGREISEQDLPHPNRRAWIILLYMVLHKLPVDQQKLIEDNWPDEEINTSRNNMRQAIFRHHNELAAYHDVKVIDARNRMLSFSDEVKITTDAQEMEDIYQQTRTMPDGRDKLFLLEKAFFLYRGRLFIQGDADIGTWLYTYTAHYNQIYVDITSEILSILGHNKDYRCIMDFGPAALDLIGPRNLKDTLTVVEKGGIVCQTGLLGGVYALNGFDPIKDIPNGVYLTGFFSNYPTQQVMDEIFAFLKQKKLVPVSGKVFGFDEIREAVIAQDEGKVNGKIIVRV